jgi:hypothetical protein
MLASVSGFRKSRSGAYPITAKTGEVNDLALGNVRVLAAVLLTLRLVGLGK